MSDPLATARLAWGDAMPDWVLRLAEECQQTSQNRVAEQLGRSGGLVSQVLRAKYAGDMAGVEDLVRGVFMRAVVSCPALGDLPTHECRAWRRKAKSFAAHNAQRVAMYRACTRCPRFKGDET